MDRETAACVRETLREPTLAVPSQNVSVSVKKGVLTLTGSIPSLQLRSRILDQVANLPGVDRIEDHLVIKP